MGLKANHLAAIDVLAAFMRAPLESILSMLMSGRWLAPFVTV